jgi:glycosyltransferase involved in cell wall biosynthesis
MLMTMHRMSQGGADRVAVLLANGFHAAGIPTDFLLLRSGGEGEEALSQLFDRGVRIHTAGPPMGSRHLELVRGVKAIRDLAASIQPSVVLASSSNMGLVTGVACRELRSRGTGVAMKLTNPVIRPRDRLPLQKVYRRNLYRFVFAQHDRVLTLTDAERSALAATYPDMSDRFVTVPNAYVSKELRSSAMPEPKARGGGPNLLTLARMMPQKRLDVLLHAFARLGRPEARLTILGDGPLRPSLEGLAHSLGISDRVEMPGFVEDVLPALRTADLFVLSSDYEGLPAAVIEALACNVPVVTTDCFPGARSMLGRSAYCAVTPIGDAEELARAINETLALGRPSGLREIAADYGIEASIAAHTDQMFALMGAG